VSAKNDYGPLVQAVARQRVRPERRDLTPSVDSASNRSWDQGRRLRPPPRHPAITITSTQAEMIERWLAAYMYQGRRPRLLLQGARRTRAASFLDDSGRLQETAFLRRAALIDTSGCLTSIFKRQVASIAWGRQVPCPSRTTSPRGTDASLRDDGPTAAGGTYWPKAGVDRLGQPTVGSPVEISVQWDNRILGAAGQGTANSITVDATMFTNLELTIGTIVRYGTLNDWQGTGVEPAPRGTDGDQDGQHHAGHQGTEPGVLLRG